MPRLRRPLMTTTASENGYESQRKAAAINYLLGQIGLSKGRETEWWNHRSYPELGNRTPTQAWLAGDEDGVRKLVDTWYGETQSSIDQHRSDPEFMAMLRRKAKALRGKLTTA
jgi:hypothetical protein